MKSPEFDAGSFKDPEGRIVYAEGRVFRVIATDTDAERVKAMMAEPFIQELQKSGKIVKTCVCSKQDLPSALKDFDSSLVLEHEKIPVVTYPYEWSFSQLKDAALLTLELMETAIKHGYVLKDATPFNVMPFGGKMKHIDFLSFEMPDNWMGWVGYRQFLQEILYPLVAAGKIGIDFRALIRGYFSGIPARDMLKITGKWRALRFGLTKHLLLAAAFEKQFTNVNTDIDKTQRMSEVGPSLVQNIVVSLKKKVMNIEPAGLRGVWSTYEQIKTYSDDMEQRKDAFVNKAVADSDAEIAIDLGCNTGRYSALALQHAKHVVSIDLDEDCIDVLYRQNRDQANERNTVMVADLSNPAGGMGWANSERKSLSDRLKGDVVLALALVHHLRISSNITFDLIFKSFSEVAPKLVIEWVDREDPMVRLLLKNRKDVFSDYTENHFIEALEARYKIVRSESLGDRTLYYAELKSATNRIV